MDGFGTGGEGRLDEAVRSQIAVPCRSLPQPHRCVGGDDVRSLDVSVRIDGNDLDAQVTAGSDDAERDLAAVGDEDAPEWRQPRVFAQGRLCRRLDLGHRGMLPCFFGGFVSRLSPSISKALIRRGRVSDGRMTSSTYPRAAATYGFANRSSYSPTSRARAASGSSAAVISSRCRMFTAPSAPIRATSAVGPSRRQSPR